MKFLSTALLCTLLYLSEETECSSTNGTGVVFRLTGRGLTYALNKAYSSYNNKKFNMSYSIGPINKTINETNYWIDKLQLINHNHDAKDLTDFDVKIVPESKCLNISVKGNLATMKGEVTCRNITHRDHSQNCTIVAKMPWFFQLHIGRSTKENTGKYFTTEVCNSTDNCSLPINATTTEFTNCSQQQETLCRNEELLFRDFFRSLLRDKLKSICSIVRVLINNQLNYYMKSINLAPNIAKTTFWVDLTMPLDPVYNTTFLETFHKGDLHWLLTDEVYPNCPNTNFDLNTETDNSSMTYLWISRNVVKAALEGLQIHGLLHFKITADTLDHTSGLNTTCRVGVCVGRLVPSLAKMYPNCFVDLDVYSLETPDILFEKDLLIINGKFIMFAYVRCPSSPSDQDIGIASLVGGASMRIKLSITNSILHGKIDAIEPNLENIDSEISGFDVQTVNFIIRSAVIVTIEPLFNQYGEKGVEIPIVHAHMINSSVRLIKDAIIIGSDIEADPTVSLNTV
ncbi:bactericidal permeability-increasing protein-like [Crassostrea virginica]